MRDKIPDICHCMQYICVKEIHGHFLMVPNFKAYWSWVSQAYGSSLLRLRICIYFAYQIEMLSTCIALLLDGKLNSIHLYNIYRDITLATLSVVDSSREGYTEVISYIPYLHLSFVSGLSTILLINKLYRQSFDQLFHLVTLTVVGHM